MNLLIQYAMSFVGVPYRWGGENPIGDPSKGGFDCSGLVQEILRSVGMDPPGDQTAQALYNYFEPISVKGKRGAGCLSFYGRGLSQISHVAFMLDEYRVIEAGGGGSAILTRYDAALKNAFVRVRPYNMRRDLLITLGLHYPFS